MYFLISPICNRRRTINCNRSELLSRRFADRQDQPYFVKEPDLLSVSQDSVRLQIYPLQPQFDRDVL